MRKISLVSILIIATMRIFRTAVTCTRRTITTIAGERFKISTIVTDMIVRTVFHISTINFIRRFVNKFSMFFDFFTNSRLVLADGKSDSSFSRAVFDTFFNDDSFLNSKMLIFIVRRHDNLPFMKMENRYQVNYTGERVNSTKEV